MDTWEYRTFLFGNNDGAWLLQEVAQDGSVHFPPTATEKQGGVLVAPVMLNKLGEQGWELAASAWQGRYLIFKRRKP